MPIPRDVIDFVAEHNLAAPSARRTNSRTAVVVATYAGAAWVGFTLDSLPVWILAWLVQAFILNGAAAAMHEAVHGNLYRSKAANRVAGVLWANAVLMNFSLYRAYHLQHHAHTRSDGDPEPQEEFGAAWQYVLGMLLLGYLFIGGLWVTSLRAVLGTSPWYARTQARVRDIRVDGAVLLAFQAGVVIAAVLAPGIVLRLWLAPALIVLTGIAAVTALPEHYLCARVPDVFQSTRTTLSNPLFRYYFWNTNYHAGHHLYPGVPFHAAPRLHDRIADRIANIDRSYTSFHVGLLRTLRSASSAPTQAETGIIDLRERPAGAPVQQRGASSSSSTVESTAADPSGSDALRAPGWKRT